VYYTNFNVEFKEDASPLTLADRKAHDIISLALKDTGIPVLSEEGRAIPYEERKNWKQLWVVDPLDGTKEFVKKNDEFTVNIALIENNHPVMGVVYAPVLDEMFVGEKSIGAYKISNASNAGDPEGQLINKNKIPRKNERNYYAVVASRSHLNAETTDFIDEIKKEHEEVRIVSKGSSLKLCMVAEGVADVYPRFAPTSEWDTAAGHAVVVASGAKVVQAMNEEKELEYNKENVLNPWFIVRR
ncbi:MAG: 3'(2'),5'-bisphosphate nucleotidase CysQ, partial [Bacteroidales bacterium]|nr:3'(2'),5'-bisphosphate nucleotidase CysQ [Bacteroidales bacterium]